MYQPDIFRHSLSRLVAILQAHSVRFHLTGGITSVAYGEPRMTQDVDVVVDNRALARVLDSFIAAAQQAGFMVKLTTTYEGQLRCRAEHGPSGTTLITARRA